MREVSANSPFFSVIMPTYNHGKFISSSIRSVRDQTFTDWELIIIDNYSEDDTESIVASFSDSRIKYLKFRNEGSIARSRNHGIERCTGRYVALLDSDDLWSSFKLEVIHDFLKTAPEASFVSHKVLSFHDEEKIKPMKRPPSPDFTLHEKPFEELIVRNFVKSPSAVIRKSTLPLDGPFDEGLELKGSEDWDLWIRISLNNDLYFLEHNLSAYRVHPQGISKNWEVMARASMSVLKKNVLDNDDIQEGLKNKCRYTHIERLMDYYSDSGETKRVLNAFLPGFKLNPFSPWFYYFFLRKLIHSLYVSKIAT